MKDLPGEVCGGVKAGEFGVEPRLLMEFAQHGFGGRFARGDEACGEIVPEAGTDRLGEASLLKEQAAVGCEGEKPHDDGGESECAEDRAFGAGDDAAAGISHVEELEGALLGEAVVCKSGRQGRKRGLEAFGREKLEDARAHLGCEGPKFGIRAQGVHDVFAQASELESSSDESPEGLGAFGLHPGAKLREEFRGPAASDRVESIHGLLSCPIPDACAGRAARRGSSGRR